VCPSKNYYDTSLYDPTFSGSSVDPTLRVHSSDMSVLLIVRNQKVQFYSRPGWNNIHTKIHPNLSSGPRAESCEQPNGRTDKVSPICIHFMHTVQKNITTITVNYYQNLIFT
jgi:hypothetical protein